MFSKLASAWLACCGVPPLLFVTAFVVIIVYVLGLLSGHSLQLFSTTGTKMEATAGWFSVLAASVAVCAVCWCLVMCLLCTVHCAEVPTPTGSSRSTSTTTAAAAAPRTAPHTPAAAAAPGVTGPRFDFNGKGVLALQYKTGVTAWGLLSCWRVAVRLGGA